MEIEKKTNQKQKKYDETTRCKKKVNKIVFLLFMSVNMIIW